MVEAFEKFFDKFVKMTLEAHFKSNPPEPYVTWLTKCEQTFGGAMKKNFQPMDKEDVATLPHWDTYIICTLLKEYLQTVS